MKPSRIGIIVTGCLIVALAVAYGSGLFANRSPANSNHVPTVNSPQVAPGSSGRVTMIDVGATECIPCKMMAPIMKELEEEYAGIADIFFIDVWQNRFIGFLKVVIIPGFAGYRQISAPLQNKCCAITGT